MKNDDCIIINPNVLYDLISNAAYDGDLKTLKKLTKKYADEIQDEGDHLGCGNLIYAIGCSEGHLPIVRYILTDAIWSQHVTVHDDNDYNIVNAAKGGHLDIIKYLLTSPELTEHINIRAAKDSVLYVAGVGGYMDVMEYILTSPDLIEHIPIDSNHNFFERWCEKNNQWDFYLKIMSQLAINSSYQNEEGLLF